jgi:hypothetical protein
VPGVVLDAPFVVPVPGRVPHGEPLGVVPGVFVVLGLTVDGCAVLPGVAVFGEVGPGTLVLGVLLGDVELGDVEPGDVCPGAVCGVAVPACGVAVLAGGVAVPAGGVAGEPGVELCPALLEPPAGAVPPGAACATAQLAQHKTIDSNVSFRDDMFKTSRRFNLIYSSFLVTPDKAIIWSPSHFQYRRL